MQKKNRITATDSEAVKKDSRYIVEIKNSGGRVDHVGPFRSLSRAITWSKEHLRPTIIVGYIEVLSPLTYDL